MKLEYRKDGVVYPGVAPLLVNHAQGNMLLVLAWFDGEPELWAAENTNAVKTIEKLYIDEWGVGRVIFQVFTPFDYSNRTQAFVHEVAHETHSTGSAADDQMQLNILRDKAQKLLGD